jgi:3-phenylpropionate/trans-cinnamate dioxygenase ferredoxin subunit
MPEKKYTWYKIADHINELEFGQNHIAIVQVKDNKLCIGMHRESYFAFAYKCPHAGGVMANGYIDALGNVVCPVHRYKFDMQNGRNVSTKVITLKTGR